MIDTKLYTKSVEQLMLDGKISVYHKSFKRTGADQTGQPIFQYGVSWWVAEMGKFTGEGETPRDAIINLHKNVSPN